MALIVANWKMNLDVSQASLLVERLSHTLGHSEHEIVLCPSYIALYPIYQMLVSRKLTKLFSLGAQNMYFQDEGAFTGEISPLQLRDLVEYVIVGHSERRTLFAETDKLVAKKIEAALRHEITPILCVGETMIQHKSGQTHQVVQDQLEEALHLVANEEVSSIVIAYEPIWAIGTGNNDSPDDVEPVLATIRQVLTVRCSKEAASKVKLLYGGSVNTEDASSYLKLSDCNGLLVGHASLNDQDFSSIAQA